MGLSENVGYIPNEIAIFHRADNDQQNLGTMGYTIFRQTHMVKRAKCKAMQCIEIALAN